MGKSRRLTGSNQSKRRVRPTHLFQIRIARNLPTKNGAWDAPYVYYDTGISRKQYQKMLTALLNKPYQKNSETMYEDLQKSGGNQKEPGRSG